MKNDNIKCLTRGAVCIALSSVLSLIKVVDLPLGGGLTPCSMLPIILFCFIYDGKKAFLGAFAYSLVQTMFGLDSIQYGKNTVQVLLILILDYILAYTFMGFSFVFKRKLGKNGIVPGTILAITLRFLCHFASGLIVWNNLFPNELGYAPVWWSFIYNGSYMLAELIVTTIAAFFIIRLIPVILRDEE